MTACTAYRMKVAHGLAIDPGPEHPGGLIAQISSDAHRERAAR